MFNITTYQPGVYKVIKVNDTYTLDRVEDYFVTPKKLYGDMGKHSEYFWNSFSGSDQSMGVLLTGASGSGKTVLTNVISNIAILNGMIVVMVTEIVADAKLISFIDSLTNAVILLDEFGKVFNLKLQDKALTMLSSAGNKRKLFLITENRINMVSQFIINRPGRVRYHIDYIRLDEKVFKEYCADFDMDPVFLKELELKYRSSSVFSFDHLSAIVTEHMRNKDFTFEEVINILNLSVLSNPKMLELANIYDIKEGVEYDFKSLSFTYKSFNEGRVYWVLPIRKENPNDNENVDYFDGDPGKPKRVSGQITTRKNASIPNQFDIKRKYVIEVDDEFMLLLVDNRFRVRLDVIN